MADRSLDRRETAERHHKRQTSSQRREAVAAGRETAWERARRQDEMDMRRRWPELSENDEASLKQKFQSLLEQADATMRAIEAAGKRSQYQAQSEALATDRREVTRILSAARTNVSEIRLNATANANERRTGTEEQTRLVELLSVLERKYAEPSGSQRDADALHSRDASQDLQEITDATWNAMEKRSAQANSAWQEAAELDTGALRARWGMNEVAEKSIKHAFEDLCLQAEKTRQAIDSFERVLAVRQLAERNDAARHKELASDNELAARQKQERQDVVAFRQVLSKEIGQARHHVAESRRSVGSHSQEAVNQTVQRFQERAVTLAAVQQRAQHEHDRIALLRRREAAPEMRTDRQEGRVTPIQAINSDQRAASEMKKKEDSSHAADALRDAEQRARKAIEEAVHNAEKQIQAAHQEMKRRHDQQKEWWRNLRPDDQAQQKAVAATQQRERKALADDIQTLSSALETIRQSVEQQAQDSKKVSADRNAHQAAFAALETNAKELVLRKTQAVRESNLFYDFDHWQPQSKYGKDSNKDLSNKASNIGFMTADENRRKGKKEFRKLPELQQAVALKDALEAGEAATRKLVGDMLGSLRFSEVVELNTLWQRASDKETRSYSESQAAFRKLLASDNEKESAEVRQAAETVRHALRQAGVEVIAAHGDSVRLRLDDSEYRR